MNWFGSSTYKFTWPPHPEHPHSLPLSHPSSRVMSAKYWTGNSAAYTQEWLHTALRIKFKLLPIVKKTPSAQSPQQLSPSLSTVWGNPINSTFKTYPEPDHCHHMFHPTLHNHHLLSLWGLPQSKCLFFCPAGHSQLLPTQPEWNYLKRSQFMLLLYSKFSSGRVRSE